MYVPIYVGVAIKIVCYSGTSLSVIFNKMHVVQEIHLATYGYQQKYAKIDTTSHGPWILYC